MAEKIEVHGFAMVTGALGLDAIDAVVAALDAGASFAGLRQPHRTMPSVQSLIASRPLQDLVQSLTNQNARVVRSILFDKTPDKNWGVPWHQDLTIAVKQKIDAPGFTGWSTKDGLPHVQAPRAVLEKMLTLRIHLDDCGEDNGPLAVLSGTHRHGWLNETQIDHAKETIAPTLCPAARGDILLMKPLLLHSSSRATKPARRRVLHLEFAAEELPSLLAWAT